MRSKKTFQDDEEEVLAESKKIPSVSTLLHIFWLKKWFILLVWLILAIPAGTLLSIFNLPTSYTATTVLRFPNVVGAQTNVMRDVAITERESIISILNSWQVIESTIKKLGLRLRITTPEVFQKNVFKNVSYTDELGIGKYTLVIEKGGERAALYYKPEHGSDEYSLYQGALDATQKITVPGLEITLADTFIKQSEGLKVELQFRSLEQTAEDFRDVVKNRPLGGNNLEIKIKDRDPFYVADILNTLRSQFLEVYYGTTEVQDVGILVQMEKDLNESKKKVETSEAELSNFYTLHPDLMGQQNTQDQNTSLTYLEARQEGDRIEKDLKQLRSVAQAKPISGTEDDKTFWAAEMIQTMIQADDPRAMILRGSLAVINSKQASYRNTLGPEHPKVLELAKDREALLQQIDETELSLEKKLTKELSDSKLSMVKSAPTHQAPVPIRLQLELERLNQVNVKNQQIYDRLLEGYNRAKLTTGSEFFKVAIVDPARPAIYKPPSLQTRLLIASVAVVLLSLTIPALFLLWQVFFLKIWTKDDVEKLLKMKALGVVAFNPNALGKVSRDAGKKKSAPVNAPEPARPPDPLLLFYGSAYRIEDLEAFRVIREEAENYFRNERTGKCCLMITSTQPNEGKTMIICNLAMTFARKGKRTLLIDADFRLGRVDKMFNMPGATGIDELLGQSDLTDAQFMEAVTLCFQPTMQRNLVVVPRKKFNPNAGEMVSSDRFKAFIRMAKEQFDVVLIDTPPVMITPEPLSLAEVTDGVIYVCRSGNTNVSDSLEAIKVIEERGVNVAVILNGVRISPFVQNRYTKYSYYYGQSKQDAPKST